MIAVDTNVLIYACDSADARRQKIALDLVTDLEDGVLSGSRLRVCFCFPKA
jgi:hypothetical protein